MARKPKPSGRKRLPDKGRPLGRRQVNVRPPRPRFLIVCFELWYLLHFDYHDTALSRTRYQQMLTQRLGKPYRKNALDMYDLLKERQTDAIRNALRLLDSYGPNHNPERDNPCATVHQLVQELNRYVR